MKLSVAERLSALCLVSGILKSMRSVNVPVP